MIWQRRYVYYQLTCFYALAFLIVTFRVTFFAIVLTIVKDTSRESSSQEQPYSIPQNLGDLVSLIDMIATYLELILGIQQCNSMMDLLLKLQETLEAQKVLIKEERES